MVGMHREQNIVIWQPFPWGNPGYREGGLGWQAEGSWFLGDQNADDRPQKAQETAGTRTLPPERNSGGTDRAWPREGGQSIRAANRGTRERLPLPAMRKESNRWQKG